MLKILQFYIAILATQLVLMASDNDGYYLAVSATGTPKADGDCSSPHFKTFSPKTYQTDSTILPENLFLGVEYPTQSGIFVCTAHPTEGSKNVVTKLQLRFTSEAVFAEHILSLPSILSATIQRDKITEIKPALVLWLKMVTAGHATELPQTLSNEDQYSIYNGIFQLTVTSDKVSYHFTTMEPKISHTNTFPTPTNNTAIRDMAQMWLDMIALKIQSIHPSR